MRLLCPAKINLHLRVGPLRADGFHSLLSWFCTTGLSDTLTMEHRAIVLSALPDGSHVTLECDDADLPCDRRNLVVKIGDAWGESSRNLAGARVGPISAKLQKRIPAGAGLGGGSSDGAFVLLGLNKLWNTRQSVSDLAKFAAGFGSDLPFFFFGPSSICSGRGERVHPTARPLPRRLLLILPPILMPTAEVYRTFDAMGLGQNQDVENPPDWLAWSKLDANTLLTKLVNDLEPPAFAINPTLAGLRERAEQTLQRPVRMSGSGSSLFTLFDTQDEVDHACRTLVAGARFSRIECVELAPDFIDNNNALAGVK